MLNILLLVIVGCIISVFLRQNCREYLLLFQLGFSLLVLIYIFNLVNEDISVFSDILNSISGGNEIIKVLVKAMAVSVATKIGCDICRESKNLLLEDVIEISGRLMIFVLSVPYIIKIINLAIAYI